MLKQANQAGGGARGTCLAISGTIRRCGCTRTANVASYLIGWGLLAATPTAVGVTDSYLIACCHHLQLLPRRPGVAQRPSPRRGQQRRCPPPDAQPADHLEQRLMLRLLKQIQHPRVELAQLDDPLCRRGMAGCGVQRMPGGAPPAGAHGSRGAGARTPAKLWWQTHSPPCHPTANICCSARCEEANQTWHSCPEHRSAPGRGSSRAPQEAAVPGGPPSCAGSVLWLPTPPS